MNRIRTSVARDTSFDGLTDDQMQADLLDGVSRTFALTIPQLPMPLCTVVSNAYLLCRIVDTIEDEVALTLVQKRYFCDSFIDIVAKNEDPARFTNELKGVLSSQTLPAEHCLIRNVSRVISITRSFETTQRDALACCIKTMAKGMPEFQAQPLKQGLASMDEMSRYCYYVAGCVGEMLAKLFCHYSSEISQHRGNLLQLSVSFGQGLQMTNILKDIWDDYQRGVCWLPREVFNEAGYDLSNLAPGETDEHFREGLEHIISITHDHLQDAMSYTLLIPNHETGIRNFCLWALGMALLTLRKIRKNLDFVESSQVKISRSSVKATIFLTGITVRSDTLLKILFKLAGAGLSTPGWHAASLENRSKC